MKDHHTQENFTLTAQIKGTSYWQTVDVFVFTKRYSVIIQTDKPAYRPDDKIHFRLLVLDANLKPYHLDNLEYNITDSNENVVADNSLNRLKSSGKGVHIGEYKISDSPPLGNWNLQVRIDNGKTTKRSFEVSEFVLPRFNAQILSDSNVLLSDVKLKITVFGEYSFGEFVSANATISARVYDDLNSKDFKVEENKTMSVTAKRTIDFDMIRELNIKSSCVVKVLVVLEEKLTGKKANETKTIIIHEKLKHEIELIPSDIKLKPGFPFSVKAVVKNYQGMIENDDENDIEFRATYFYSQPDKAKKLKLLSSTFSEFQSIRNGKAEFIFDVNKNVSDLMISAFYLDTHASINLTRFPSRTNEYLKLQILTDK